MLKEAETAVLEPEVKDEPKEVLSTELYHSKESYFNHLMSRAEEIQSECEDYTLSRASLLNLHYYSGEISFKADSGEHQVLPMTKYSFGQLCSKMGVPARYIERCHDKGLTSLAEDNLNTWIDEYEGDLFIRRHADKIRGILSTRYSVLDAPDILSTLSEVIEPDQYKLSGYLLNPERFHARLISHEKIPNINDDLFAGIQIDSSDVGRSILRVSFLIFKQVCTNGLTVNKASGVLFEQKHIGISSDDFQIGLSESMNRIPEMQEYFYSHISDAQKERLVLNAKETEDLFGRIQTNLRLKEEGIASISSLMKDKYSPTKWGLINAITEHAQEYTLERRLELERYAGEILVA